MKTKNTIRYSGFLLAILFSASVLMADELPKEKEEGEVLESVFIGEKLNASDVIPSTIKTSDSTKDAKIPSKKYKDLSDLPLGEGGALSDDEINRSLLQFSKEEELRKKALKEQKERAKIEASQPTTNPMVGSSGNPFGATGMISPSAQTISIEEQKARLMAGLSQFPNQQDPSIGNPMIPLSTSVENAVEEVPQSILVTGTFYGVSCVNENCVLIGSDKRYSVGDTMSSGEKIISISKEKLVTSKGDFSFEGNSLVVSDSSTKETADQN